jgi:signal transduction histidine kinase
LKKEGNYITIVYLDDGKGFDMKKVMEQPAASGGMGFSNIFSRINSLKGEINIDSEPRRGTKVYLKVKMHDD